MIKFDKNEFLKPQIYSTLDEYKTRCNVTKEIIEEIEQLQQENKILKENAEHNDKVVDKVNWENQLLKKENQELKEKLDEYENPKDMTLMMMWCTEKVKDENKQLKSIIYELREYMSDIDYKMGWQYVEYLDRLLPEKILKDISE